MTIDLIWLPRPVYSVLENKAILIGKYLELSFQQVFICMIQSSGKKSTAVLIPEVLLAITNSEMIFQDFFFNGGAPTFLSSLVDSLIMGTILRLSSCNSSPPRVMDASATNLNMQTCKDLVSIKFSFVNKLYSVRSEFTCCSNNLARALVIGPVRRSSGYAEH
jgi:hypothetical protein